MIRIAITQECFCRHLRALSEGETAALSRLREPRCHDQIDPITPPVPPRELHEHGPPARRKILNFRQIGPRRENFAFCLKSTLALTQPGN
jgi:hypothetical protein